MIRPPRSDTCSDKPAPAVRQAGGLCTLHTWPQSWDPRFLTLVFWQAGFAPTGLPHRYRPKFGRPAVVLSGDPEPYYAAVNGVYVPCGDQFVVDHVPH